VGCVKLTLVNHLGKKNPWKVGVRVEGSKRVRNYMSQASKRALEGKAENGEGKYGKPEETVEQFELGKNLMICVQRIVYEACPVR